MPRVLCTATSWLHKCHHVFIGSNSALPHGPLEERKRVRLPLVFCCKPLLNCFCPSHHFNTIGIFLLQLLKSCLLDPPIIDLWCRWLLVLPQTSDCLIAAWTRQSYIWNIRPPLSDFPIVDLLPRPLICSSCFPYKGNKPLHFHWPYLLILGSIWGVQYTIRKLILITI